METYSFRITLSHYTVCTEALANSLYESGLADALISSSEGIVSVSVDREAESFMEAVDSAIKQITSAGCEIKFIHGE